MHPPLTEEASSVEPDQAAEPDPMLLRIADELAPSFDGIFGRETIHAYVNESYERLAAEARIQAFLPILTRRIARAALVRVAASQENVQVSTTPEVLFVCVHNAGRSQMAAALVEHHAQGRVRVRSAGSNPGEAVNPAVVEVMREIGLDVSQEIPKKLLDEHVAESDVVITMGCGDACPIFPGKRYEDWVLVDPAGKSPDEVRKIRDEIDQRVRELLAQIAPA